MIKVWWLMWYFTHYDGPTDPSVSSWYNDTLKRDRLCWYLISNKNYREDLRDTFERWITYFDWHVPQNSESRKKRVEKRFRELDDIIDKAIELGYLTVSLMPHEFPGDARLSCNYKGRDFLKLHYFIEACAREFGYLFSILTSFLFGAGSVLALLFWNRAMDFLVTISP